MKNTLFVAAAAAAVVAAVAAMRPSDSRAAEPADSESVVGAVMQVDMSPVVSQIKALRNEVALMKQSIESLQKALEETQAQQAEMLGAIKSLAPNAWEYKLLRTLNETESRRMGRDGWEMVAVTPQGWIFFRKPLTAVEALPGIR